MQTTTNRKESIKVTSMKNLIHQQGLTWMYSASRKEIILIASEWALLEEYQAHAICFAAGHTGITLKLSDAV